MARRPLASLPAERTVDIAPLRKSLWTTLLRAYAPTRSLGIVVGDEHWSLRIVSTQPDATAAVLADNPVQRSARGRESVLHRDGRRDLCARYTFLESWYQDRQRPEHGWPLERRCRGRVPHRLLRLRRQPVLDGAALASRRLAHSASPTGDRVRTLAADLAALYAPDEGNCVRVAVLEIEADGHWTCAQSVPKRRRDRR
jgi:hypothetical protein